MNEAQMVEWFHKWRKPIRSWMRNRASVPTADIDDLCQEVFLRLLRYSNDTVVDNPQGYLFRIAANVANEWRERARIRKPHDAGWLEGLLDDGDQPDAAHWRGLMNARVAQAIDELPNRQGIILIMHANDGLTYSEIAQDLGITYRIVLRDLTRAYSTLRFKLKDEIG